MELIKEEFIGVYIHIPFCIKKCNYCDFPSFQNMDNHFGDYANALCKEIESAARLYTDCLVDSIFFGGGTPSVLPISDISKVFNVLSQNFNIAKNAEISIEVNPGTISIEKAMAYRELGFNRISIGFQSANNNLLKFMGRIHTKEIFKECVDLVKNCGFNNLNADIIFGIPNQTMADWKDTVEYVLRNDINHLSCYSLKIEENTQWYVLNEKGELPTANEDLEREMYYWVISRLSDSGFIHYEISNFARPGFECIHNLKYWTNNPYIGIGAAAHSYINDVRYSNIENPVEYIRKINNGESPRVMSELIGQEERLSERFILGLRLIEGINLSKLEQEFGYEAIQKYKKKIKILKEKNLVCVENGWLKLTKYGLDYANLVWVEFI